MGPRSSAVGARIEAPKAPRGVGRGVPLSNGRCVWEGAVSPPQKIPIFELKRRVLVHSGLIKLTFDRPCVSIFGQQPSRGGRSPLALFPVDPSLDSPPALMRPLLIL